MLRLFADIHQVRDTGLHPKSQFVLGNTRGNLRVLQSSICESIQLSNGVHDVALLLLADAFGISCVQHRVAGTPESHALKLSRQET